MVTLAHVLDLEALRGTRRFCKLIVEFTFPFLCEELLDLIAPADELIAISPLGVDRVRLRVCLTEPSLRKRSAARPSKSQFVQKWF